MIERRRTIARRNPELVYKVEAGSEHEIELHVWVADERGRLIANKYIGNAWIDEPDEPLRAGGWHSSKDTERLYMLPDEVRELLFQLDDSARAALAQYPAFQQRRPTE